MKMNQTLEENCTFYGEGGMDKMLTPNEAIEFWKIQTRGLFKMLEDFQRMTPRLIKEKTALKEALQSIACADQEGQATSEYWKDINKESIIETIVNDTKIARKALKDLNDSLSTVQVK